jgi:hypothetical protein
MFEPQVWKSFVDNGGMFLILALEFLTDFYLQVTMLGASVMCVLLDHVLITQLTLCSTQLNIHQAKPGSVEVSLKVEPYNGS